MKRLKCWAVGSIFLLHCYTSPYYNPDKPHHTKTGFQNPNPNFQKHGFSDLIKWGLFQRPFRKTSLNPKDYNIPYIGANKEKIFSFYKNKGKWAVTWIGHATTLIQMEGMNILTDPIWSERCSPISFAGPKRYTPPGIAMEDLPPIHAVVISHNHYDHLDIPTLQKLNNLFQPAFFVGLGNEKLLQEAGIHTVYAMDWWETVELTDGLQIHFTPTQHFSARGLWDRDRTLWGSYVLEKTRTVNSKERVQPTIKIYFAGDTGYFSGFREIGAKWQGMDLAILPIGAYEPRWFMSPVHTSPEDAVQAFLDLQAKYMLPMHYNTFVLSDEPLDEPLQLTKKTWMEQKIPLDRLLGLKIGESFFEE